MIKNFQILSKIGEGAYSSVYKVRRISDNTIYALKRVKFMQLKAKEKENALNEIRIIASIRHPNIICYKEAFWENNTNSLWLANKYHYGVLWQWRPLPKDYKVQEEREAHLGKRNLGHFYPNGQGAEPAAQEQHLA